MNLIIGHGISWNRTLYATLRPPWCDVNQRLISIPLLHRTIYARWIACTYTDNRVFIFHLLIYRARAPHNWLRIGVENNRTVRKEEMGSRSRAFASTQRTWIQQGTGEANHPQINRMFHIAWKRLGTEKKNKINKLWSINRFFDFSSSISILVRNKKFQRSRMITFWQLFHW